MTVATATQVPVDGDIVTARPWANGLEAARPVRGVVTGPWADGMIMVWFPSVGRLCNREAGRAVQPVYATKATVVGHILDWSAPRQRLVAKSIHQSGMREAAPLYQMLYRISRTDPKEQMDQLDHPGAYVWVSSSGPCVDHEDVSHAKCLVHGCCIGHNTKDCRSSSLPGQGTR